MTTMLESRRRSAARHLRRLQTRDGGARSNRPCRSPSPSRSSPLDAGRHLDERPSMRTQVDHGRNQPRRPPPNPHDLRSNPHSDCRTPNIPKPRFPPLEAFGRQPPELVASPCAAGIRNPSQIQTTLHVRDGGSFSRKQPFRPFRSYRVRLGARGASWRSARTGKLNSAVRGGDPYCFECQAGSGCGRARGMRRPGSAGPNRPPARQRHHGSFLRVPRR
jgi:hypothetical protein